MGEWNSIVWTYYILRGKALEMCLLFEWIDTQQHRQTTSAPNGKQFSHLRIGELCANTSIAIAEAETIMIDETECATSEFRSTSFSLVCAASSSRKLRHILFGVSVLVLTSYQFWMFRIFDHLLCQLILPLFASSALESHLFRKTRNALAIHKSVRLRFRTATFAKNIFVGC